MATAARPGELGQLLAAALGDSTLEILYAFDGSWVDSEGHPHPLPGEPDRECTSLAQDDEVVAVVVHRRGLLDDPQLVFQILHAGDSRRDRPIATRPSLGQRVSVP